MAWMGSVVVRVTDYNDLIFEWTARQDAVAGVSHVDWKLLLRAGEYGRIDATPGSGWAVTVDGQAFSGDTSIHIANNTTKELASGTVALQHDENGEKSFDFAFSQEMYITFGGQYIQIVSGSGSAVLDALDVDAAPITDKAEVELGGSLVITPQGPADAVYRLHYRLGSAEGEIARDAAGQVIWQVPTELGGQMPYTERASLRILCDTYRNGVRLGKTREAAVTVVVPEAAVPVVELVEVRDTVLQLGVFLQNRSRLVLEVACWGAMGSVVKDWAAFVGGKRYSGEPLADSGAVELELQVTDSRGRVGRCYQTLEVLPYRLPSPTLSAHRCQADGTPDDNGGWVQVVIDVSYAEIPGSHCRTQLYADDQVVYEGEDETHIALIREAPVDRPLRLTVLAEDPGGTGIDWLDLSTAYCTMDLLHGGRGVAFGAVAQREELLCAMDARFTGKIYLPDGTELMERLGAFM